jgi:hypothetical protein
VSDGYFDTKNMIFPQHFHFEHHDGLGDGVPHAYIKVEAFLLFTVSGRLGFGSCGDDLVEGTREE